MKSFYLETRVDDEKEEIVFYDDFNDFRFWFGHNFFIPRCGPFLEADQNDFLEMP